MSCRPPSNKWRAERYASNSSEREVRNMRHRHGTHDTHGNTMVQMGTSDACLSMWWDTDSKGKSHTLMTFNDSTSDSSSPRRSTPHFLRGMRHAWMSSWTTPDVRTSSYPESADQSIVFLLGGGRRPSCADTGPTRPRAEWAAGKDHPGLKNTLKPGRKTHQDRDPDVLHIQPADGRPARGAKTKRVRSKMRLPLRSMNSARQVGRPAARPSIPSY